ncbi:MAG TPA: FecR domain-containing protein [Flavisolibacter sp.]
MSESFNDITHELLVKYLLGEASPGERAEVEQWLDGGEDRRRLLSQLRLLLEESGRLKAPEPDEEQAWQRFRQRIAEPRIPAKKKQPFLTPLRIAAVFILLAGIALWVYFSQQDKPAQTLAVQSHGRVLTDTLPDGSMVTLNRNSSLSYKAKFKGDTRSVALKGEAFFDVRPDKSKPFVVQVNDVTVRVVGTSFNIKAEGGKTEVIVETGIVQVTRGGKTIELRPKQKVRLEAQDTMLVKEEVKDELHNYYHSREFVCDNTPLWKLVEVLNEAYDVRIEIGRNGLKNLPLTATFNNESLDNILNVISATFDIKVERQDDRIILR